MYHVSPRANRTAILAAGLKPATPLGGLNDTGVYLWQDLELHWELVARNVLEEGFDPEERPFDLWQVDVSGLELEPDGFARLHAHGSWCHRGAVSPARLKLAGSFPNVAAYLRVQDLDDLREQLEDHDAEYGLADSY